jgi:Ca-activated chloride channel homolog
MSQETLQEAMRRLQKTNGLTIYAIGVLGGGMESSGRDALQRLADGGGGAAYFPEGRDQVNSIKHAIAHDIRSQYIVAYKPRNQNVRPSYQSVRVEARAPGMGRLTVPIMNGYYQGENTR